MILGLRPSRSRGGVLNAAGRTCSVVGGALILAGALDCTAGAEVAARIGGVGVAALVVGVVLVRRHRLPAVMGPAAVLRSMLVVFGTAVVWSTVVYVVTGAIDDLGGAVFESVAGLSTTAATVVADPQELPRGVLAWRSLTQWMGGLGAVLALVGLLPELGVGAPEPGVSHRHEHPWRRSNRHLQRLVGRLAAAYAALTAVGIVLLGLAGLSPYDAFSVSLTTVSTGGFTDRPGSIAAFDSAAVEWVVLGGMAASGASLALFWRGLRGSLSGFFRSVELRAYLLILTVAGSAAVVGTAADTGLTATGVRRALFSVVSALSTTGFTVTDWTTWSFGLQAMLVALFAVGAMSGSAGGGFSVLRAMTMWGVVRREVVRQLEPHRVVVVKVGDLPIGESVLSRMVGFQVLSVLLVVSGAVGLAATGVDLVGAGSGAVSALSTVGPALGDLGPAADPTGRTLGTQVVLIVLMAAGRLEIYPVARAVSTVAGVGGRVIDRLRRVSW